MNKKKGYSGYRNIDETSANDSLDIDVAAAIEKPKDSTSEIKSEESNQLDSYNDDMPKKSVQGLYVNFQNHGGAQKVTDDSTAFGSVGNKPNTEKQSINKNSENNHKEKTNNSHNDYLAYNGFKYDEKNKSYDFRETSFSASKIELERISRDEVKKNKEILRQMESKDTLAQELKEIGLYNKVSDTEMKRIGARPPGSVNKRKKVAYFRIISLCIFIILLICLTVVTFSKNSIAKKYAADENTIGSLTKKTSDLSLSNADLQSQLDSYKNGTVAPTASADGTVVSTTDTSATTTDDTTPASDTPSPTDSNQSTTSSNSGSSALPTTHTVVSGDSLYNLAKKYYGDGDKYTKITDANGIKGTNLVVGHVLTIPK